MARKRTLADILPPGGGIPVDDRRVESDFVTFYSRLTHTLENVCGRDKLAARLAEERADAGVGTGLAAAQPALSRVFRRIGMITREHRADVFTREFVRALALAVSRPESQAALLLGLFAAGDERLDLKAVCGATPQCQICLLTRECDHFSNPRAPEMATLPPAARLMAGNNRAVSDAELLGLVLFGEKATGREELVETFLARYGRLLAVSRADAYELAGLRGMTRAQAVRMTAVNTLYRRLLEERRGEMLRIGSARDIYDRYAPELRDSRSEAAVLLMLDAENRVIRDAWFGQDSPSAARLEIADLLRPAVREYAARVALVHNHPGNNPQPSLSDLEFTRRLRGGCDILGLGLVDHVIVTDSGYYSFAEEGMLGG